MSDKHSLPRGLYAIVDDQVRPEMGVLEKARLVFEGGARIVQLRLKHTPDRQALDVLRAVVTMAAGRVVIVNDRVDLALAAGAHGVHLGDDDLPADVARRVLGPQALIGVTTRTLADIERAKAAGADHVGLGPIFHTSTKQVDHQPLGLEVFAGIARQSPLPVVGIAGITLETIGAVARAHAHCAAVVSALFVGEPVRATRALVEAFGG